MWRSVIVLSLTLLSVARTGVNQSTPSGYDYRWLYQPQQAPVKMTSANKYTPTMMSNAGQPSAVPCVQQPMYSRGKINVGVYYESLCPFSRNFVIKQVFPVWRKLHRIIDLRLIPFGNCYVTFPNSNDPDPDKAQFECQHGQAECIGNTIMACAVDMYDEMTRINFLDCMYQNSKWFKPKKAAYDCAQSQGRDWASLVDCYDTVKGKWIQIKYGNETRSLVPPHTFVPWLTINGYHDKPLQKAAMKDMHRVICEFYKGPPIAECQNLS